MYGPTYNLTRLVEPGLHPLAERKPVARLPVGGTLLAEPPFLGLGPRDLNVGLGFFLGVGLDGGTEGGGVVGETRLPPPKNLGVRGEGERPNVVARLIPR